MEQYPWLEEILEKYDKRYMKTKQNKSSASMSKSTVPPNQYPITQQQYYNLMRSHEENRE